MTGLYQIAAFEFLKNVKKPSFWLITLAFPALMTVIGLISVYSTDQAERRMMERASQFEAVGLVDQSGLIDPELISPDLILIDDFKTGKSRVLSGELEALIYYPEQLINEPAIEVYAQDTGLIDRGRFDQLALNSLRDSILRAHLDPEQVSLISESIRVNTSYYLEGQETGIGFGDFIVPIVSIILYFTLAMFSTNFLLASISEEKENRMMEIILTSVTDRQLIWGKIFGSVLTVLAQVALLLTLSLIILAAFNTQMDLRPLLGEVDLSATQVILAIYYLIAGFLFLAAIMTGVGAAMPTYKEAQSLSSLFVILSIFPIYFAVLIIQEPSGLLAKFFSYFPFTAPMVLITRNALGALEGWEIPASLVALALYTLVSFYLAGILFRIGSLEYTQKISLKRLFGR